MAHEYGTLVVVSKARELTDRLNEVAIVASSCLLGILFGLLPWLPHEPMTYADSVALTISVIACLVLGPVLVALDRRAKPRGEWHIGAQGVTFQPDHALARSVGRKDVERVRWQPRDSIVLRGHRHRVVLTRLVLGDEEWDLVVGRLKGVLAADFDLAIRPYHDPPASLKNGLGPRLVQALRIVGTAMLFTAVVMGPLWWFSVAFLWPSVALRNGLLAWVLAWSAFGLWLANRAAESVNPTWRRRLTKATTADPWSDL
jgi:hypothetical protein